MRFKEPVRPVFAGMSSCPYMPVFRFKSSIYRMLTLITLVYAYGKDLLRPLQLSYSCFTAVVLPAHTGFLKPFYQLEREYPANNTKTEAFRTPALLLLNYCFGHHCLFALILFCRCACSQPPLCPSAMYGYIGCIALNNILNSTQALFRARIVPFTAILLAVTIAVLMFVILAVSKIFFAV